MKLMVKSINIVDNEVRLVDNVGNTICVDAYHCDRIIVEFASGTRVVMSADIHNYFKTGGPHNVAIDVIKVNEVTDMVILVM